MLETKMNETKMIIEFKEPQFGCNIMPSIRLDTDKPTNGDIIKAMFPNHTIGCTIPITDRGGAKFYRTTINGITDFTEDWWNAPYKGE